MTEKRRGLGRGLGALIQTATDAQRPVDVFFPDVTGAVAAREFPIVAGAGRRENTTAFVSRGVGTVYVPVRVNCPPEVAILRIQPLAG